MSPATAPFHLGREVVATDAWAETHQRRRLGMVNGQLRTGGVVDQEALAAFLEAPRERFVAKNFADLAYLDRDVPARGAKTRRLVAPLTLARMIQAAAVKPGDRALDVGGGSGYGAAILNRMGAKVVLLESDPGAAAVAREELAGTTVEVIEGRLDAGFEAAARFDVIVIEGAFEVFPATLFAQLSDGGRLVGIDATSGAYKAVLIEKDGEAMSRRALMELKADVLDGFQLKASFVF